MAKFISHDGVDKNGVRAEVTVMTGTGVISEIVGRGKQNEDGSYRNVEVVFTPDNPLLKRKVYGLLDTTATDLWAFIQDAHKAGKNVTYRIESQRRNGVDRSKGIGDLVPTEDVRRILAAVDNHFSHEAKTNPAEDPDNENPSALTRGPVAASTGTVDVAALAAAVAAALTGTPAADTSALFAPDGRLNYGSAAVARAAKAEQFALDHLLDIYTPTKAKKTPEVSDEIMAQAGSLALHLLTLADRAHKAAAGTGGTTLAPEASRTLALDLVIDAVGKRHPAPLGTAADAQADWADTVTEEAADRLYGIGMLAQGQTPAPRPETPQEPAQALPEASQAAVEDQGGYTASTNVDPAPFRITGFPLDGEEGFITPGDELIARVRTLCESANVMDTPQGISDWMEAVLGVRSARKVHALALAEFCMHYEQAGPDQVRTEVHNALAA